MKKQTRIREPEEIGLPDFSQMIEGYILLMTITQNENGTAITKWTPIHNSYGYLYDRLGNAINRVEYYTKYCTGRHICIMNVATGKIVWATWELKDNPHYYVEIGDVVA